MVLYTYAKESERRQQTLWNANSISLRLGLNPLKKVCHGLGLARKADPYVYKKIPEHLYCKGFYTLYFVYRVKK